MMRKSVVKSKLRAGQPVLVNKICFPNADLAELIGLMGFDCLWICTEHLAIDASVLKDMIRACRASGMDSMIRTGQDSYDDFTRFLESGATGLMIPHVKNSEHAREIVKRAKFPPIGKRGIDGISADADFGLADTNEYIKHANDETFIVVQIEDEYALDDIEQIAQVEGIDVLFLGPADLSLSMGITNQVKHKKILQAIEKIIKACENSSAVCGTPYIDVEHCKRLMNMGVKFFTGTSDSGIIRAGFSALKESLKQLSFDFRECESNSTT